MFGVHDCHRLMISFFVSSLASKYSRSPSASLALTVALQFLLVNALDIAASTPLSEYPTVPLAAVSKQLADEILMA